MDKISTFYTPPAKKKVSHRLWELAEQVALITKSKPNRWLKAGEWVLERALIDFKELNVTDVNGHCKIKNKAAYMTWIVNKYTGNYQNKPVNS